MDKPRKIDTAPKDGSSILVWDEYERCWQKVYWSITVPEMRATDTGEVLEAIRGWVVYGSWNGLVNNQVLFPKVWLPLPEPYNAE